MTISFLFSMVAGMMMNFYQARGEVVDVAKYDNIVNYGVIIEANDQVWAFYTNEPLEVGDNMKVVFYNNNTQSIYDDQIVNAEKLTSEELRNG